MKDDWNLKQYVVMKYHHMMEEGFYPEEAIAKLYDKLQEELAKKELTSKRISELFGVFDSEFTKEFWKRRAKEHVCNEALTTLEDDEELLRIKIRDEQNKVLPYEDWKDKTIVDLGSGWGSWAFKFIERGAKKVTCVDYIEELCKKGEEEAKKGNITNIEFVNKATQDFITNSKFDIVFMSGISVYMNDSDYKKMLKNIDSYTKKGTEIILRDGTGVPTRYIIDREWSERLKSHYSAIYRTREEYIIDFESIGFKLVSDEDMFPKGHPLNKFSQTRLRLYKFRKVKD